VFDLLAVAAVIDGKTLCVHGGLSPDVPHLDHIRMIERKQEVGTSLRTFILAHPSIPRFG
jgi:diadenosine tetraphosphatase ApaH/serine/threonine PP2A family protein phosphatase